MKAIYSLFPKLFPDLSAASLADLLQETGFDHVDLLIRDGYWVTEAGLKQQAADFVRLMQNRGVGVVLATTSYTPDALLANPTPVEVMSDLGIGAFRMGYFRYDAKLGFEEQIASARAQMEKLAELCVKHRVKAIYQVHHSYNQLIQHSVSALSIVQGLPAEAVGIMLDPGNQFHEGREHYGKAIEVLGGYLAAVGVKDAAMSRSDDPAKRAQPNKGWTTKWVPCQDGANNWADIGAGLNKLEATRPVIVNFQPFYDEHDRPSLVASLKAERAYIEAAFGKGNG
ncbi:MAG: xylose isomerase [Paenibacillus sp.]|nr:xylose isomerase [Paenibacillus sp.]